MIRPWIVGFKTTLGHMFKKPISVNYPDEKVPMFPKWRGKQVLMRDENGLEKCVACGLCAVACPADEIYLEALVTGDTVTVRLWGRDDGRTVTSSVVGLHPKGSCASLRVTLSRSLGRCFTSRCTKPSSYSLKGPCGLRA